MEDLVSIGFTKKTYGTKGELKVKIKEDYLEDFLKANILFLGIQGKEVPFFKEYFKVSGAPLLKFEEVDDRNAALSLTSKEIFLRSSDVLKEEEREYEVLEDMVYKFLINFIVIDAQYGELGKIETVEEYPQQEMAIIEYEGRKLMIPLNEHFINSIDEKSKIVNLTLPEGLLDL